jgi:hypothetical protein
MEASPNIPRSRSPLGHLPKSSFSGPTPRPKFVKSLDHHGPFMRAGSLLSFEQSLRIKIDLFSDLPYEYDGRARYSPHENIKPPKPYPITSVKITVTLKVMKAKNAHTTTPELQTRFTKAAFMMCGAR